MTLFHRNVALILYDVEDFLTTLKKGGGGGGGRDKNGIRGSQTGSDVDSILDKIQLLKKEFPSFDTQLEQLKKQNEGSDYSGGSSAGSAGGIYVCKPRPKKKNLEKKSLT